MTKRMLNAYFNTLLPLYANGRANAIQRRLVKLWLRKNPAATARYELIGEVRKTTRTAESTPSNTVWVKIQSQVETPAFETRSSIRPDIWRVGMGIAVLLLALVWFAFPPKVILEWSVEGDKPQEFHVYRSLEAQGQEFMLVEEIPVSDVPADYHFEDLQLVPGRQYAYKIEAVSSSGEPITSELILSNASSTLPSQLALILTFLVSVYGVAVFVSERKHWPAQNLRVRLG